MDGDTGLIVRSLEYLDAVPSTSGLDELRQYPSSAVYAFSPFEDSPPTDVNLGRIVAMEPVSRGDDKEEGDDTGGTQPDAAGSPFDRFSGSTRRLLQTRIRWGAGGARGGQCPGCKLDYCVPSANSVRGVGALVLIQIPMA